MPLGILPRCYHAEYVRHALLRGEIRGIKGPLRLVPCGCLAHSTAGATRQLDWKEVVCPSQPTSSWFSACTTKSGTNGTRTRELLPSKTSLHQTSFRIA